MRAIVILATLGLAGLVGGGQALLTSLSNPEPTTLDCQAYLDGSSSAGWLRLQGCVVSVVHGAAVKERGQVVRLYLPVYSEAEWQAASRPGAELPPARLLLETRDLDLLHTYRGLAAFNLDPGTLARAVASQRDKVFVRGELSGLVQSGVRGFGTDRARLRELGGATLAERFTVIEHDAQPSLGLGIGATLAGLIAAVAALVLWRRR